MIYQKKHKLRLISAVLAFSFLAQELVYAAPAATPLLGESSSAISLIINDPRRLEIPSEFCILKEVSVRPGKPLIIQIEDAHTNVSGQQNLAATLDALMSRYSINLVLSEGGVDDCSLTPVKKIASPQVWKRIAKKYLMDGKISGEEYLNLTSEHPMSIVGLEDKELYLKSVQNYAALAEKREKILSYLALVRRAVEKLKNRLYPADILVYEKSGRKDQNWENRFRGLLELAAQKHMDLEPYPNAQKMVELELQGKLVDFDLANLEYAALMRELGSEMPQRSSKASKLSQMGLILDALDQASQNGLVLSKYPHLNEYAQYLRTFSDVDLERLMDELEKLEDDFYASRLSLEDSKLVRSIDRYLSLLEVAYKIQMTTRQFELFTANEPDFSTMAYQGYLNRHLVEKGYAEDLIPLEPILEEGRSALKAFYDSVSQRDFAFLKNAKEALSKDGAGAAFMIAGGYHTPHLKKILNDNGYSVVVLTPCITGETNQKKYEKLLLDPIFKKTEKIDVVSEESPSGFLSADSDTVRPALILAGKRLSDSPSAGARLSQMLNETGASQESVNSALRELDSRRPSAPSISGARMAESVVVDRKSAGSDASDQELDRTLAVIFSEISKEIGEGRWARNEVKIQDDLTRLVSNREISPDPKAPRHVVIGDIHGDLKGLLLDLLRAGLINLKGEWDGKRAILVQMGDYIDRGPHSYETDLFLRRLQSQARAVGGNVVRLIGNHEEMFYLGLSGDKKKLDTWVYNMMLSGDKSVKDLIEAHGEKNIREALKADPKWGKLFINIQKDLSRADQQMAYESSGLLFVHAGVTAEAVAGQTAQQFAGYLNGELRRGNLSTRMMERALWDRYGKGVDGKGVGFYQVVGHEPQQVAGAEVRFMKGARSGEGVINVDTGHLDRYGGNKGYLEIAQGQLKAYALDPAPAADVSSTILNREIVERLSNAGVPYGLPEEVLWNVLELANSEAVSTYDFLNGTVLYRAAQLLATYDYANLNKLMSESRTSFVAGLYDNSEHLARLLAERLSHQRLERYLFSWIQERELSSSRKFVKRDFKEIMIGKSPLFFKISASGVEVGETASAIKSFNLDQARAGITIGRSLANQVVIGGDLGVSKGHAKIILAADGRWYLQDLGSVNGVEFNFTRTHPNQGSSQYLLLGDAVAPPKEVAMTASSSSAMLQIGSRSVRTWQQNGQLIMEFVGADGQAPVQKIVTPNVPLRIGRSNQNDIVLSDPTVSNNHARIEFLNGAWLYVDLNSTNGSFVNGQKVVGVTEIFKDLTFSAQPKVSQAPAPAPQSAAKSNKVLGESGSIGALEAEFEYKPVWSPERSHRIRVFSKELAYRELGRWPILQRARLKQGEMVAVMQLREDEAQAGILSGRITLVQINDDEPHFVRSEAITYMVDPKNNASTRGARLSKDESMGPSLERLFDDADELVDSQDQEAYSDAVLKSVGGARLSTSRYPKVDLARRRDVDNMTDLILTQEEFASGIESVKTRILNGQPVKGEHVELLKMLAQDLTDHHPLVALRKLSVGDRVVNFNQMGVKPLNTWLGQIENNKIIKFRQTTLAKILKSKKLIRSESDSALFLSYKQDKFVLSATVSDAELEKKLAQAVRELEERMNHYLQKRYPEIFGAKGEARDFKFTLYFGVSQKVAPETQAGSDDEKLLADYQALKASKIARRLAEEGAALPGAAYRHEEFSRLVQIAKKLKVELGLGANPSPSESQMLKVRKLSEQEIRAKWETASGGQKSELERDLKLKQLLDLVDLFDLPKNWIYAHREEAYKERDRIDAILKQIQTVIKAKAPPKSDDVRKKLAADLTEALSILQTSPKDPRAFDVKAFHAKAYKNDGLIVSSDAVGFYASIQKYLFAALDRYQEGALTEPMRERLSLNLALQADDQIKLMMENKTSQFEQAMERAGLKIRSENLANGQSKLLINRAGGDEITGFAFPQADEAVLKKSLKAVAESAQLIGLRISILPHSATQTTAKDYARDVTAVTGLYGAGYKSTVDFDELMKKLIKQLNGSLPVELKESIQTGVIYAGRDADGKLRGSLFYMHPIKGVTEYPADEKILFGVVAPAGARLAAPLENLKDIPAPIADARFNRVANAQARAAVEVERNEFYSEGLVDTSLYGLDGRAAEGDAILLRKSVAEDLRLVDQALRREGYRLFLRDGWRSLKMQEDRKTSWIAKNPENLDPIALQAKADKLFSDAEPNAPHLSGGAFDVEIHTLADGQPIVTKAWQLFPAEAKQAGHPESELYTIASTTGFQKLEKYMADVRGPPDIRLVEILRNRRFLYNILTLDKDHGGVLPAGREFVGHPHEFWHYGRGDKASAVFTASKAHYEMVDLRPDASPAPVIQLNPSNPSDAIAAGARLATNRRQFLKGTAAAAAVSVLGGLGWFLAHNTKQTPSIIDFLAQAPETVSLEWLEQQNAKEKLGPVDYAKLYVWLRPIPAKKADLIRDFSAAPEKLNIFLMRAFGHALLLELQKTGLPKSDELASVYVAVASALSPEMKNLTQNLFSSNGSQAGQWIHQLNTRFLAPAGILIIPTEHKFIGYQATDPADIYKIDIGAQTVWAVSGYPIGFWATDNYGVNPQSTRLVAIHKGQISRHAQNIFSALAQNNPNLLEKRDFKALKKLGFQNLDAFDRLQQAHWKLIKKQFSGKSLAQIEAGIFWSTFYHELDHAVNDALFSRQSYKEQHANIAEVGMGEAPFATLEDMAVMALSETGLPEQPFTDALVAFSEAHASLKPGFSGIIIPNVEDASVRAQYIANILNGLVENSQETIVSLSRQVYEKLYRSKMANRSDFKITQPLKELMSGGARLSLNKKWESLLFSMLTTAPIAFTVIYAVTASKVFWFIGPVAMMVVAASLFRQSRPQIVLEKKATSSASMTEEQRVEAFRVLRTFFDSNRDQEKRRQAFDRIRETLNTGADTRFSTQLLLEIKKAGKRDISSGNFTEEFSALLLMVSEKNPEIFDAEDLNYLAYLLRQDKDRAVINMRQAEAAKVLNRLILANLGISGHARELLRSLKSEPDLNLFVREDLDKISGARMAAEIKGEKLDTFSRSFEGDLDEISRLGNAAEPTDSDSAVSIAAEQLRLKDRLRVVLTQDGSQDGAGERSMVFRGQNFYGSPAGVKGAIVAIRGTLANGQAANTLIVHFDLDQELRAQDARNDFVVFTDRPAAKMLRDYLEKAQDPIVYMQIPESLNDRINAFTGLGFTKLAGSPINGTTILSVDRRKFISQYQDYENQLAIFRGGGTKEERERAWQRLSANPLHSAPYRGGAYLSVLEAPSLAVVAFSDSPGIVRSEVADRPDVRQTNYFKEGDVVFVQKEMCLVVRDATESEIRSNHPRVIRAWLSGKPQYAISNESDTFPAVLSSDGGLYQFVPAIVASVDSQGRVSLMPLVRPRAGISFAGSNRRIYVETKKDSIHLATPEFQAFMRGELEDPRFARFEEARSEAVLDETRRQFDQMKIGYENLKDKTLSIRSPRGDSSVRATSNSEANRGQSRISVEDISLEGGEYFVPKSYFPGMEISGAEQNNDLVRAYVSVRSGASGPVGIQFIPLDTNGKPLSNSQGRRLYRDVAALDFYGLSRREAGARLAKKETRPVLKLDSQTKTLQVHLRVRGRNKVSDTFSFEQTSAFANEKKAFLRLLKRNRVSAEEVGSKTEFKIQIKPLKEEPFIIDLLSASEVELERLGNSLIRGAESVEKEAARKRPNKNARQYFVRTPEEIAEDTQIMLDVLDRQRLTPRQLAKDAHIPFPHVKNEIYASNQSGRMVATHPNLVIARKVEAEKAVESGRFRPSESDVVFERPAQRIFWNTQKRSVGVKSEKEVLDLIPESWPMPFRANVYVNQELQVAIEIKDEAGNTMLIDLKQESLEGVTVLMGQGNLKNKDKLPFGPNESPETKAIVSNWMKTRLINWLTARGFRKIYVKLIHEPGTQEYDRTVEFFTKIQGFDAPYKSVGGWYAAKVFAPDQAGARMAAAAVSPETQRTLLSVDVEKRWSHKYELRRLLKGGPIRQPDWFVTFKPDVSARESMPKENRRDKTARQELADASDIVDFEETISKLISNNLPLPVVYKPNNYSIGFGVMIIEKEGDSLKFTLARPLELLDSAVPWNSEFLTQRDLLDAGIPQEAIEEREREDLFVFRLGPQMDGAQKIKIIVALWKKLSTLKMYTEPNYDPGMMESFVDAIKINGMAYETRHDFFDGVEPANRREWIARIGTSAYFSNQSGRVGYSQILYGEDIFEPLYALYPKLDREAFEAETVRLINAQREYAAERLKAMGFDPSIYLSGNFDLMWLKPETNDPRYFPRPVLIEANLYIHAGARIAEAQPSTKYSQVYGARLADQGLVTSSGLENDVESKKLLAKIYMAKPAGLFGNLYWFYFSNLKRNGAIQFDKIKIQKDGKSVERLVVNIYNSTGLFGLKRELAGAPIDITDTLDQIAAETPLAPIVQEEAMPTRTEAVRESQPVLEAVADTARLDKQAKRLYLDAIRSNREKLAPETAAPVLMKIVGEEPSRMTPAMWAALKLYEKQRATVREIAGNQVYMQFGYIAEKNGVKFFQTYEMSLTTPASDPADALRDYKTVYAGAPTVDFLRVAKGAEITVMPRMDAGQERVNLVSFVSASVFSVMKARLDGLIVIPQLQQLWSNLRGNVLTSLDATGLKLMKAVPEDATPQLYAPFELKSMATFIRDQIAQFSQMVLAVGSAA